MSATQRDRALTLAVQSTHNCYPSDESLVTRAEAFAQFLEGAQAESANVERLVLRYYPLIIGVPSNVELRWPMVFATRAAASEIGAILLAQGIARSYGIDRVR